MARIEIPELCLVVLVGVTGSGKSSFAAKHFSRTEVVSSDFCRSLVADDEADQSATPAAFDVLHLIAAKRLAGGRIVVVDATNVQPGARRSLVSLAKAHHVFAIAIVLDVAEELCAKRNAARPDRRFGPHVLRNQASELRRSLPKLRREGFHRTFVLHDVDEIDSTTIERVPLWTDRRADHGPFDIIGDVHGCYLELVELLLRLGYTLKPDGSDAAHPDGRRALFLGDLVDRGPATPAVLRLAMGMVGSGHGLAVPGNHEAKLARVLKGADLTTGHGLAESLLQLEAEPPQFTKEVVHFIDGLVSHLVLDDGRLVVAHAGMREEMAGRSSGAVRSFALYGDTTGETDEYGLPVRYPWATDYRGRAAVVYGHTPVVEAEWVNNTICIDTGCVFGNALTCLRWPERELVSVPAHKMYWKPARPLAPPAARGRLEREPTDLDISDVVGRKIITTRITGRTVTIREENGFAALEVMSRYAADPRWIVYLPPTMSPTTTSARPGLLEHPDEAFSAYARDGLAQVICEEKHMGSRAVVIACRDPVVAARRFGVTDGSSGAILTRTGRPLLTTAGEEEALLAKVAAGLLAAGIWEELKSDWVVLDCELLPWSAKAGGLIRRLYSAVGTAATATLAAETAVLRAAVERGACPAELAPAHAERLAMANRFIDVYRSYCWPVAGIDDLRLAPFQVLAAEGAVHALTGHRFHLDILGRLADTDPATFRATRAITVDLADTTSRQQGVQWWEELTAAGGEGMVVKPAEILQRRGRGIPQPGLKVRGREYLRIIYGPEYTTEANLSRLRDRTVGHKRSLALREYALGIEALERFVAREPLYAVHECVFGVLALESEPVDPRL